MNTVGGLNTNECMNTAEQIFNFCGVDSSDTLHVDKLMDKFAPFLKENKNDFSYLKSLLDPKQINPEVTVPMLAATLSQNKIDLDESFNLAGGPAPQDSDSGISSDGFQILEELQCELREKSYLVQQMQARLELTDRHHDEALAAVTAERDTLRAQLNIMREENASLSGTRRDYEEAAERLSDSERELSDVRRALATARHRALRLGDQLALLETERLTLQELLTKSKNECHRINEMYATRQSQLLEQNECLKREHADLSARLQDQDELMQQIVKEKVLLEMELKDVLNKSNRIHSRADRSVDVSYTEDQLLTALDSLNADSKFIQENQILDEDSFLNELKEDSGRPTNMSLFDEIRLSFCNGARLSLSELNCTELFEKRCETLDSTFCTLATQTEDVKEYTCLRCKGAAAKIETVERKADEVAAGSGARRGEESTRLTSAFLDSQNVPKWSPETSDKATDTHSQVFEMFKDVEVMNFGIQTEFSCNNCGCQESVSRFGCDTFKSHTTNLEKDLNKSHLLVADLQKQLNRREKNFNKYEMRVEKDRNALIENFKTQLKIIQSAYTDRRERTSGANVNVNSAAAAATLDQTSISTQTELPCAACVRREAPRRSVGTHLWGSIKCLFQLFAVVCFISAVYLLAGVRRWPTACRDMPWRWLRAHDFMDLLLRVEYLAEVPM